MLSLTVLAASLLAAPSPGPLVAESIGDQYPTQYLIKNKSAAVFLELIITSKGRIAQCRELAIVGHEGLGRTFCRLQRAQLWRVATDSAGRAVDGVARILIRMTVPGTEQADIVRRQEARPDIELRVNRLPPGRQEKFDVGVALEIDATGAVVDCAVSTADVPAQFAKLACDSARQLKVTDVAIAGIPLPHFVIGQKVRFSLSGQEAAAAR